MSEFDDLRRQAQSELEQRDPADLADLSSQDMAKLIEELHIHQVELEIQNEELRQAQQQIEASWERYRRLYDSAPVGYLTLDPAGLILAANITAAEQLRVERQALLQQDFRQYIAADQQDKFLEHHRQLMETLINRTCELQLIRADGSRFEAHLESTPVIDGETDIPQIQTILFDISDRKQLEAELDQYRSHLEEQVAARTAELQESKDRLEQALAELKETQEQMVQQERLAAVGQLAAGIAHDFNNILTAIIGQTELLQMRSAGLEPNDRRSIGMIARQGDRAAHLIRQILDFSRKSIRQPRLIDAGDFLRDTVAFLKRTIPETIQIRLAVGPGTYVIEADPTQLQQLLTNLAVNARQAMPKGGVLALGLSDFTLTPDEPPPLPELLPGRWVVLTVSDTGQGIPADVLPRIFEPFFTTKEVGQGSGLGLAQVYGIVAQHAGCIGVESRPGEGTTFTIYLPSSQLEPATPTETISEEYPRGNGELILLIEDDPVVLEVIEAVLESINYQVVTAPNGQAALALYREQESRIALVLADMVMPELHGAALLRALQAEDPQIKVIIMSGYPRSFAEPFLAQGVIDWIQKPPRLKHLAQALHRALHAPPAAA